AYSAVAMMAAPEPPVKLTGFSEDQTEIVLWGRGEGTRFELHDRFTRIKTCTLAQGDIENPPPAAVVAAGSAEFREAPGAVSAHVNATRVCNFYREYLRRHGIDGNGMELVSYVDCTAPKERPGPEWRNAVWWKGSMWYGQVLEGGRLRSLARHLDVI